MRPYYASSVRQVVPLKRRPAASGAEDTRDAGTVCSSSVSLSKRCSVLLASLSGNDSALEKRGTLALTNQAACSRALFVLSVAGRGLQGRAHLAKRKCNKQIETTEQQNDKEQVGRTLQIDTSILKIGNVLGVADATICDKKTGKAPRAYIIQCSIICYDILYFYIYIYVYTSRYYITVLLYMYV